MLGCGFLKKLIIFIVTISLFCCGFSVNALENSAKAAIVINGTTRSIIYSKNIDKKLPMASTTKIMTALILAEQNALDTKVTVTAPMVAVEGSSMGLRAGDTVTYNDLLYGILLCSGNDAANTVATTLCGTVEKFAEVMNKKASALGLKSTHFVTPSGLDADGHYTTAHDLALLASYALENKVFKQVASTKSITLNYGGENHYLSNHNKMLKIYDGAIGVKTGYTSTAGRCLVSAAERNGTLIIAVTLNDRNDWNDHKIMLDFGFENSRSVSTDYSCPSSIKCIGSKDDVIKISSQSAVIGLSGEDKLEYITYLPKFVYAGINKGDKIGYTDVFSNGHKILTLDIVADENAILSSNSTVYSKFLKLFLALLRGL